jgi:hypothetical protein
MVVVGAGAAGIAAAVSAARRGINTLLLDRRPAPGGTGAFSGLTTLCGCYDDQGELLLEGFAQQFIEALAETKPREMGRVWVLPFHPARFREVAEKFLNREEKVSRKFEEQVAKIDVEEGIITSVNGIQVRAVIDCTGTAEVARLIGVPCLETTATTQAPAIVFPLCQVKRDVSTRAAATQVMLAVARAGLPPLTFEPNLEPETVTVKFTGTAEQVLPAMEFLRANVKGFENCVTPISEFVASRRAGRMIRGQYLLTGDDVLSARKFPDAVARCAWPMEQWDAQGRSHLRYLPPGERYEIPARALRCATIPNLFMAGKTISADEDAIASARVMGCCLATGAAAGNLAAQWVLSQPDRCR